MSEYSPPPQITAETEVSFTTETTLMEIPEKPCFFHVSSFKTECRALPDTHLMKQSRVSSKSLPRIHLSMPVLTASRDIGVRVRVEEDAGKVDRSLTITVPCFCHLTMTASFRQGLYEEVTNLEKDMRIWRYSVTSDIHGAAGPGFNPRVNSLKSCS